MNGNICAQCMWWRRGNVSCGACQRYAPTPISAPNALDHEYLAAWPITEADDFCGEFKAAE